MSEIPTEPDQPSTEPDDQPTSEPDVTGDPEVEPSTDAVSPDEDA